MLLYTALDFTLYVGWRSSSKVGLFSLPVLCLVQGKEKISSARHARELMKLKRGTQLGLQYLSINEDVIIPKAARIMFLLSSFWIPRAKGRKEDPDLLSIGRKTEKMLK